MAGTRKWPAMRWKSMSTTCATSWGRAGFAPCAALVTPFVHPSGSWRDAPLTESTSGDAAGCGHCAGVDRGRGLDRLARMPDAPAGASVVRLPHKKIVDSDSTAQRPAIVLRDAQGQLLIQSVQLPAQTFDPHGPAFHTVTYARRRWRVFQGWDSERQYWIQVAAPLDERDELLRKLLAPTLLALLALLVLVPPTGTRTPLHRRRCARTASSTGNPSTGAGPGRPQ